MKDTNSFLDDLSDNKLLTETSDDGQNLIAQLKPVSVLASNENTSKSVGPLMSREGIRKKYKSQAASMIHHTVCRRKKTDDQVKYLRILFNQLGGRWDGQMRREAMKKTGLSRI